MAIVGRPNVGKSTLFNGLTRSRDALVHDEPGVTRDRNYGICRLDEARPFAVCDTGGLSDDDFQRAQEWGTPLAEELCDVVINHVRSQGYTLQGPVRISFRRAGDRRGPGCRDGSGRRTAAREPAEYQPRYGRRRRRGEAVDE